MVHHPVWIVMAPFWVMRLTNDWRYLSADEVAEGEEWRKEEKDNAGFNQTESPSSKTCFRSYKLLAFRAFQNLKLGEELLVGYGSSYEFSN